MNLSYNKIGYVPYLPDLSQPGDRRRFPYFAKRKNIEFEVALPGRNYDIILLTAPSDLSLWMEYKKKNPQTKFLFEMVDSLVFHPGLYSKLFKGVGRYLIKKESSLHFNYTKLLLEWIKVADVVICSNTVLRNYVLALNRNAIVSPDYLESEYAISKSDYNISGKMKIVWEGLGVVLPHFLAYKKLFESINDFCELHVITNSTYPVLPKVWYRHVNKFLDKLPISTHYHLWASDTHNKILANGDCAIIPLDKNNQFGWNKPANKLVSFWFAGLPTIVSATPAYKEIMQQAGSDLLCDNIGEWIQKLKWLYNLSADERKSLALRNLSFVKENYSDQKLDEVWESVFRMI